MNCLTLKHDWSVSQGRELLGTQNKPGGFVDRVQLLTGMKYNSAAGRPCVLPGAVQLLTGMKYNQVFEELLQHGKHFHKPGHIGQTLANRLNFCPPYGFCTNEGVGEFVERNRGQAKQGPRLQHHFDCQKIASPVAVDGNIVNSVDYAAGIPGKWPVIERNYTAGRP